MIYLDNAATSWPKPEMVYKTADAVLRECGGNPGRGNHSRSLTAERIIYDARMLCAKLFHAANPECFCFTSNATEALNLAIKGTLHPGDHVITSLMEHNSVTRPLNKLKDSGISITKVATLADSGIDLSALENAFKNSTKLVVCNHISNVTGTINPIREIGKLCREKGVLFLLDAAQSAGEQEIDIQENNIDLLAFPGHKGLLGPQGTGGLYIRDGLVLETLKEGGTGTQSELGDQPLEIPVRYESGTMNLPGIAGLAAGIRFILDEGLDTIKSKGEQLTNRLMDRLSHTNGIKIYGPKTDKPRGSVVSMTFDSISSAEAAIILDNTFNIAVRAGLHCARDAHDTLGTIDYGGTLRVSPGYYNTELEIDEFVKAITYISREMR